MALRMPRKANRHAFFGSKNAQDCRCAAQVRAIGAARATIGAPPAVAERRSDSAPSSN
jgi:hypothetical protein